MTSVSCLLKACMCDYKGLLRNLLVKRKWFTMPLCYVSDTSAQPVMYITIIWLSEFSPGNTRCSIRSISQTWVEKMF